MILYVLGWNYNSWVWSGDKLTFRPGIKLIGLIFGERSTHGAIKIEDKQNGLKAVVKIGTEKGNFFTKKKQMIL